MVKIPLLTPFKRIFHALFLYSIESCAIFIPSQAVVQDKSFLNSGFLLKSAGNTILTSDFRNTKLLQNTPFVHFCLKKTLVGCQNTQSNRCSRRCREVTGAINVLHCGFLIVSTAFKLFVSELKCLSDHE